MTLTSACSLLENLTLLEGKFPWVKCPFCEEDVTKLRPCLYWNPNQTVSHVCVECAEAAKGLTYLAHRYPIIGVDVATELMPHFKKLPSKYQTERSLQAIVTYGEWQFFVWPESTHLFVLEARKPHDTRKSYDNTFQVWFALKNIFEEGPKEEAPVFKRSGADRRSGWKV